MAGRTDGQENKKVPPKVFLYLTSFILDRQTFLFVKYSFKLLLHCHSIWLWLRHLVLLDLVQSILLMLRFFFQPTGRPQKRACTFFGSPAACWQWRMWKSLCMHAANSRCSCTGCHFSLHTPPPTGVSLRGCRMFLPSHNSTFSS